MLNGNPYQSRIRSRIGRGRSGRSGVVGEAGGAAGLEVVGGRGKGI
jgi:hypothetical protein